MGKTDLEQFQRLLEEAVKDNDKARVEDLIYETCSVGGVEGEEALVYLVIILRVIGVYRGGETPWEQLWGGLSVAVAQSLSLSEDDIRAIRTVVRDARSYAAGEEKKRVLQRAAADLARESGERQLWGEPGAAQALFGWAETLRQRADRVTTNTMYTEKAVDKIKALF